MSHVLIVDGEPSIYWGFQELLTVDGHEVSIAAAADEAYEIVAHRIPDEMVMDVRLPGQDGPVAVVRAVQAGAVEYLSKPFDLEQAAQILQRALGRSPDGTRTASPVRSGREDALIGSPTAASS